jgi:hypothetical protein
LTDYQVQIIVHRSTGTDTGNQVYVGSDCKTDFGDIRFIAADGSTPLSYWIEEMVAGTYAVFWVEVPLIPADPGYAYIFMDYGDPAASTTSDIDATFEAACDMEEGDLSDWDTSWGTATHTATTTQTHTGTYALQLVPASGYPESSGRRLDVTNILANHAYRVWFYDTGSTASGTNSYAIACILGSSSGDGYLHAGTSSYYRYWDGSGYVETSLPRSVGWHYYEFRCDSMETDFVVDGVVVHTSTRVDPTALLNFRVYCYRYTPNPSIFDDAIVRKWVDPEPTHGLWGSDELDSTNPSWDELPSDQTVDYGQAFSYDVNASDASGIAYYWISDMDNFSINSNGIITNTKVLSVGTYELEVQAYDPYGNYCTGSFQVTVTIPTTPPPTTVIPGFYFETVLLGLLAAMGAGIAIRRRKRK